jgi:very-short-patch-repair endonuclease
MWVEQRLLVELDGRAVHGTERAFETDRQRDRILLADGWRSTRVTWRQLHEEPAAIAADLRQLLRHRAGPPTL